ncbi:MAG: hypothetical protein LC769_05185 [Chloroflexi bacterium]|nr:hypothetical protein [Chloroflexota bacterium]
MQQTQDLARVVFSRASESPGRICGVLSSGMLASAHHVGDPLAFYSVAATIIPVLYLALVYQASVFQTEARSEGAGDLPPPAQPATGRGGAAAPQGSWGSSLRTVVEASNSWFLYAISVFVVAGGELIALHVLSSQQVPTATEKHLVADALVILGAILLAGPIAHARAGIVARAAAFWVWYGLAALFIVFGVVYIHVG